MALLLLYSSAWRGGSGLQAGDIGDAGESLVQALQQSQAVIFDRGVIRHNQYLIEKLIDRSKEHFWLVCLAHNNKLLLLELISFGSRTVTVVEPVDVFSFALQKRAAKLIMVHNHPSGNLKASEQDIKLTKSVHQAAKLLDIGLNDHIIFGNNGFYSFLDNGLI